MPRFARLYDPEGNPTQAIAVLQAERPGVPGPDEMPSDGGHLFHVRLPRHTLSNNHYHASRGTCAAGGQLRISI